MIAPGPLGPWIDRDDIEGRLNTGFVLVHFKEISNADIYFY
jgi:hypothetical protein